MSLSPHESGAEQTAKLARTAVVRRPRRRGAETGATAEAARKGSFDKADMPRPQDCGVHWLATQCAVRERFHDPYGVMDGWLASREIAGHLLHSEFTQIGVGYASSGDRHYYVQLLGGHGQ